MLIRISIALLAVLLCFHFPVYYDNHYTELSNLRENAYRSVSLIVVMMITSRNWYSYAVSFIELCLISANGYLAWNWQVRSGEFIAVHYAELQMTAYAVEIAIISIAILFGAAMIGTSDDNNSDRNLPRWFNRLYRMLRR